MTTVVCHAMHGPGTINPTRVLTDKCRNDGIVGTARRSRSIEKTITLLISIGSRVVGHFEVPGMRGSYFLVVVLLHKPVSFCKWT